MRATQSVATPSRSARAGLAAPRLQGAMQARYPLQRLLISAPQIPTAPSPPVAQLDRALPSGGRGQRFESSRAGHINQLLSHIEPQSKTLERRVKSTLSPPTASHCRNTNHHLTIACRRISVRDWRNKLIRQATASCPQTYRAQRLGDLRLVFLPEQILWLITNPKSPSCLNPLAHPHGWH